MNPLARRRAAAEAIAKGRAVTVAEAHRRKGHLTAEAWAVVCSDLDTVEQSAMDAIMQAKEAHELFAARGALKAIEYLRTLPARLDVASRAGAPKEPEA